MKKHSARVAPLSACNSPVLTLTKVEGDERSRDSPAPAEVQAQAGMEAGGRGSRCCWTCSVTQFKKFFWGVVVVLGVCSSWSGSTQLAKLTFKKFDAPFTLTWFATNWNFLFFPLYYIGHVFKSAEKQSPQQRYSEDRVIWKRKKKLWLKLHILLNTTDEEAMDKMQSLYYLSQSTER